MGNSFVGKLLRDQAEPDFDWVDCDLCGGDGVGGHDCGEDTCCCLEPEDNVVCHQCNGKGGWPDRSQSSPESSK
jgi:hypothetical protein